MDERRRDPDVDVEGHLQALDDELARLRKLEAAMDRRIEEAERERRVIEDATRRAAESADEG